MPELVDKPKEDWHIDVKCGSAYGCGYTYRYTEDEILKDTFKVSGYDFNGSANWKMMPFIYCGNCRRTIMLKQGIPSRVFNKARHEEA